LAAERQRLLAFFQAGAGQHHLAHPGVACPGEHRLALPGQAGVGQIDADVDELHGATLTSRAGQHNRAWPLQKKQVITGGYVCLFMFVVSSGWQIERRCANLRGPCRRNHPSALDPHPSGPIHGPLPSGGPMTRALLFLLCLLAVMPAQARLSALGGNLPHSGSQRDLAEIRKSGELRVLVNQSRNSSGEIKGQAIGIEYQRLRAFGQYLNRNARDGRELRLKIIPKPKDQLVAALQKGEGDLVAPGELLDAHPGLGISPSMAIRRDVQLVVVGNTGNRHYRRLEDMSGRSLTLPIGSAVSDALREVNQRLAQRNRPPIVVEWADSSLAVEDVLEMVQAGIYPWTAVELPIAERWR